jgi:hypothetical protein
MDACKFWFAQARHYGFGRKRRQIALLPENGKNHSLAHGALAAPQSKAWPRIVATVGRTELCLRDSAGWNRIPLQREGGEKFKSLPTKNEKNYSKSYR